jgi:hypothetical protein
MADRHRYFLAADTCIDYILNNIMSSWGGNCVLHMYYPNMKTVLL